MPCCKVRNFAFIFKDICISNLKNERVLLHWRASLLGGLRFLGQCVWEVLRFGICLVLCQIVSWGIKFDKLLRLHYM
jgi:hypothetical protein